MRIVGRANSSDYYAARLDLYVYPMYHGLPLRIQGQYSGLYLSFSLCVQVLRSAEAGRLVDDYTTFQPL